MIAEKRRIAAAAAARLEGAESVYIDEGITPQLVAEAIAANLLPGSKLTVVTSSLLAAGALANDPNITVVLLGGRVRGLTMATVDHWATRMLKELVIDLAYLGANGISREHGLTTPDPAVAAVKAQVVASAAAPHLRRRAHQVRRLQLLPVRRSPRLRGPGDRHRGQRLRGPSLQRAGAARDQDLAQHRTPTHRTTRQHNTRDNRRYNVTSR